VPALITESTAATDIGDLMEALRSSVEAAKARQKSKTPASKRAG
jgi:non-homologous end joining protein Ku